MRKTLKVLTRVIKEQKVRVNEVYEFEDDGLINVNEAIKKTKPKYSISHTSGRWDEPMELTKKDFKRIKKLLNREDVYILPFSETISLLMIEYTFK